MKILTWLRLVDDDGNFSLTHAAVYLSFYLLVTGRQVSWGEWSAFLVAMASYRIKRAFESGGSDPEVVARLGTQFTKLEAEVRKLATPERLQGLRDGLKR